MLDVLLLLQVGAVISNDGHHSHRQVMLQELALDRLPLPDIGVTF